MSREMQGKTNPPVTDRIQRYKSVTYNQRIL